MRSQEIARRYAAALFQLAAEEDRVTPIEGELSRVVQAVSEETDVKRFLAHPLVPREQKSRLLEQLFPEASPRMKNFLELLIRNQRETYLDLILDEFTKMRTEAEGRVRVSVTTAYALTEDQVTRLSERLEKTLHHPVQLDERIDDAVLGGLRIEADGHVLDGTIRARLAGLRRQLENRR